QQAQQAITIVFVEFLVECFLIYCFRQHLRDVALSVVGDLTANLRLATPRFTRLEQICHRLHHVDFESDVENLAVMKYATVMVGKAAWSKIQVETLIKLAHLAKSLA